jgi:hypothetical protein
MNGRRSKKGVWASGPEHALERVSQEDPGAKQAHHRSHCFEHRENPSRPTREETQQHPAQSKRFKGRPLHCP